MTFLSSSNLIYDEMKHGSAIRPQYLQKNFRDLDISVKTFTDDKKSFLKIISNSVFSDFIFIEKTTSRYLTTFLSKLHPQIIFDFADDPIWQLQSLSPKDVSGLNVDHSKQRIERLLSLSDFVLFPSKRMASHYDINGCKIVVPNASDPEHFSNTKFPEGMNIGVISGLAEGRGIETLIKACYILTNNNLPISLNIVHPKNLSASKKYAEALKRKFPFEWIHFRDDISYQNAPKFLSDCTLTVIPHANREYFHLATPIKLFDSMAAGRPVVVTNCYEQAKIVREENCGLVCDFTPQDMAEKIMTLLTDRKTLEILGKNGRLAVESKHNWKQRAQSILKSVEH